jgi:hypothetical protein
MESCSAWWGIMLAVSSGRVIIFSKETNNMLTIRTIELAVLASLATVMAVSMSAAAQQQAKRPNVVVLMSDDTG